jgi:hypothetical protein
MNVKGRTGGNETDIAKLPLVVAAGPTCAALDIDSAEQTIGRAGLMRLDWSDEKPWPTPLDQRGYRAYAERELLLSLAAFSRRFLAASFFDNLHTALGLEGFAARS